MKRSVIVAMGCLAAVGCAAAEKRPAQEPASVAPGQAGYPAQPSTSTPSASSQTEAPPPPAPELGNAQDDFESNRKKIEGPGLKCEDACKALGSMDRAAGRICGLDNGDKCVDVKQKLYSARDRVKASCQTCKETSTDRNAPVPSR